LGRQEIPVQNEAYANKHKHMMPTINESTRKLLDQIAEAVNQNTDGIRAKLMKHTLTVTVQGTNKLRITAPMPGANLQVHDKMGTVIALMPIYAFGDFTTVEAFSGMLTKLAR
jgi:hypothetical protein